MKKLTLFFIASAAMLPACNSKNEQPVEAKGPTTADSQLVPLAKQH